MSHSTVKFWAQTDNAARASELAEKLRVAILNEAPGTSIARERDDPHAQEAGSILLVAVSHIAVTGLIEALRFFWDRFHEPVMVQLPDGSVIEVRGATEEFVRAMQSLAGGGSNASDDK